MKKSIIVAAAALLVISVATYADTNYQNNEAASGLLDCIEPGNAHGRMWKGTPCGHEVPSYEEFEEKRRIAGFARGGDGGVRARARDSRDNGGGNAGKK
jgi:hypothetical protein